MTKKKSKYETDYLPADEYVVINNNDTDLHAIVLSLPKPPPLHLIDGYGLPPEDQRFHRLDIPRKLMDLEAESISNTKEDLSTNKNNVVTLLKIQKTFWILFHERYKDLKKEIDFIRKVWWFRLFGYWCFIKGKPTWLPPRLFYYLNYFAMDTVSGYADYRDCDRREYIFKHYCWNTTETFSRLDEFGFAIPEDDGSYKMIDLLRRICFGDAQTKNRRRGNTSKACSDGMEVTTRTIGTTGFGIQSYTEDSAKSHFKEKVLPAWDKLPVWLKPYSTSGRSSDVLKLDVAKNDYGERGLGTQVGYATTAASKYFDGKKMVYLLTDEEGKTSNCSVSERWSVNKHTLAQGDGMILFGYSSHPSTVNQLTDGSGDYQFLLSSSNFYRRIASKGQTPSGLFRVFIPAQDGLEGFIDSYGYSVTGEIKDYQRREGFKQTSEEYLQGERDLLLKENTPESMRKFREHRQLFPMRYSDSWMGTAGDIGFNMENIDKRQAELRRENPCVRGNFEWVNGIFGGDVEFRPNEESGRFTLGEKPFDHVINRKVQVMMYDPLEDKEVLMHRPMHASNYVMGVDPFNFLGKGKSQMIKSKTSSNRHSDGGLAVLLKYNSSVDKDKSMYDWDTHRFVVTYRNRHGSTDDFNCDALKCAIYFGCMVFPEMNISNTYEYFMRHKFGGYLLFSLDHFTGRYKPKPGIHTLEGSKQDIFTALRDYIEYRCHKDVMYEFLQECKDIKGIEEMRYHDLLAACGVALVGAQSQYAEELYSKEQGSYSLDDYLDVFNV